MATPAPKLSAEDLAGQYGYAAAFFYSDPELKNLIAQAVAGQWTPAKFQAKFIASNWYRTHSDKWRAWTALEQQDPATAADRIQNQTLKLTNQMYKLGIHIPSDRLAKMSRDSLMWGWSDDELNQALSLEFKYIPQGSGGQGGQASTLEAYIKQRAGDYGVTVSDSQLQDWIRGMIAGRYTEDNLNDLVRDIARSKYPGLEKYLGQGFTVRQVAAPYVQEFSALLEQNVDVVDLNDPLIQQALQGRSPAAPSTPNRGNAGGPKTLLPGGNTPQTQAPTEPMSVWEFTQQVRKDPRWLKTKNAHESLEQTGMQILKDFGLYS